MEEDGLKVIDELQQEIDELLTDEFLFIKEIKDEKKKNVEEEELDSEESSKLFLLNEGN